MGLSSLRPWFLEDPGRRDFPPLPGFFKRGPVVAAPLAAAVEPFENQALGIPCVVPESFGVADYTVVIPTALQLALERGDDLGKRQASRFLEPLFERCESSSELLCVGGAPHPPVFRIVSAFPPVKVKA